MVLSTSTMVPSARSTNVNGVFLLSYPFQGAHADAHNRHTRLRTSRQLHITGRLCITKRSRQSYGGCGCNPSQ